MLYIAQKIENIFCISEMIIHFSKEVTHIVDIIDATENASQSSELHVEGRSLNIHQHIVGHGIIEFGVLVRSG